MLNRTTYSGLSYLLAPIAVARLYRLSSKHPDYSNNIRQRFGYVNREKNTSKPLWLHAVSVGEVIASEPFVNQLLKKHPQLPIFITTTTPTGAEQVTRSFGQAVQHSYAPYDLPGSVKRFISRLDPCGLVIMETELWPNWIAEISQKRGLPSMLVNGRMSEKSAKGYKKLATLSKQMLEKISLISAQTAQDAQRFKNLGAIRVKVSGNLKADFSLNEQVVEQSHLLASTLNLNCPEKAIVAASTHPGEDRILIEAFAELYRQDCQLRLILVPRHPDRAKEIAKLLEERQLGYVLRSSGQPCSDAQAIVIGDILGELRALYGLAKMAFIGGTLVEHGGHNPLEPAAWATALVAGPSQRNFDTSFNALEEVGAMRRVKPDALSVAQTFGEMLADKAVVSEMGQSAKDWLEKNRGATERNIQLFEHVFALDKEKETGGSFS